MFMRRIQALIGGALILLCGGLASAQAPVPGPTGSFRITSSTNIECIGTVRESSSYSHTNYSGSGPLTPDTGGAFKSGAEVLYSSDFRAVNGYTQFVKDFGADASEAPNLAADTLIGYEANPQSPAALATFAERVGISIVSAGGEGGMDFNGLLSLCPFGPAASGAVAGSSFATVAAGGWFRVTEIENFSSSARATTTEAPALAYSAEAYNREGGFAGVGDIGAAMMFQIMASDTPWTNGVPPLQSLTTFSESASASGAWNFTKSMAWESRHQAAGGAMNVFDQVP